MTTLTVATHNLPLQPNEMLDRISESRAAHQALTERKCRLLTLVGPGGVGKTRLAIAVGELLSASMAGQIWFVDLASIVRPESLPSLIAATVGINGSGSDPLVALRDYLHDNPDTVLILDNFEHVLDASLMVADILESCPSVRVLTTSREPLRLKWEQRLLVPPLALPDLEEERVVQMNVPPSVALFMQRARAVNVDFGQSQADLKYVSEVCVRLDGMPLAIELAAARANVLTAEAIAFRMDDTRSLLQNVVRDAPQRHQSIHSMLDWSFDLLDDQEQSQFSRLGVFAGEFTLEAAQAILECAALGEPIDALSRLCDKGLVTATAAAGPPRYRLHEAVKAYAFERLQRRQEAEHVRDLHASYYLQLAERESRRFRHISYFFTPTEQDVATDVLPGSRAWADILAPEYGNFQSAIDWLSERGRSDLQLRLTAALQWFWWMRGQLDEGVRLLQQALEADSGEHSAVRVDGLCGLGILFRQGGRGEAAAGALAEAIQLARSLGDDYALVRSLCESATVHVLLGHYDDAESSLDEASALTQRSRDRWGSAFCGAFGGSIAHFRGRPEEAVRLLTAGATEFVQLGDERTAAISNSLAAIAALDSGDVAGGCSLVLGSLNFVGSLKEPNLLAGELEMGGWALAVTGHPEEGARAVGAAEGVRTRGFSRTRQEAYCYQRALQTLRTVLTETSLATSLEAGKALTLEEARSLAHGTLQADKSRDRLASGSHSSALLSPREQQVLELIAAGWPNGEIGKRLHVSESTVKFHVTAIFNKLGVNRRTEAIAVAVKRGILSLDGNGPEPPPPKPVA
jgi:predicted ATPase/DNA-binding CsgD family transcriptional regulator